MAAISRLARWSRGPHRIVEQEGSAVARQRASDGSGQRGSAEPPAPHQMDHARDHVVIALARQALRREAIVAAA
jgi:hypothetical protein